MLISISEIVRGSWDNYLKTFKRLSPFLGILITTLIIRYFLGFAGLYLNAYTKLSNLSVDVTIFLIILILSLIGAWTGLAIIKLAYLAHKNLPILTFKESYIQTAQYIIPTFLLSFLTAIIITLGSVLFLIPGIIFTIWYYFVNYVVIFENQKNLSCLKTSKQLVVGRWFSMAYRMLAPKIIFVIAMMLSNALLSKLIIFVFNPSEIKIELIIALLSGIVTTFFLPLFIWSDTILYFNAKENPVINTPAPVK